MNKKKGVKVLSEFMGFSKPFHTSWDAIIQVVEKLESLDLSEMMYKWEDDRGMNYNFQAVSVDIEHNKCYITIDLELDPPVWLNSAWTEKQNGLDEEFISTKLESVFWSLVEAVEYLKEKELIGMLIESNRHLERVPTKISTNICEIYMPSGDDTSGRCMFCGKQKYEH